MLAQPKITTTWLHVALQDPALRSAIFKLKLAGGHFEHLIHLALNFVENGTTPKSHQKVRCFFAHGNRGAIRGMLLAYRPYRGNEYKIGVYVDHRVRRKGIGTSLVSAAQDHYKKSLLRASAWSDNSTYFWSALQPKTDHLVVQWWSW